MNRTTVLILLLIAAILVKGRIDHLQDKLYKILLDNYIKYQKVACKIDSLRCEEIQILLQLLENCPDSIITVPQKPKINNKETI